MRSLSEVTSRNSVEYTRLMAPRCLNDLQRTGPLNILIEWYIVRVGGKPKSLTESLSTFRAMSLTE